MAPLQLASVARIHHEEVENGRLDSRADELASRVLLERSEIDRAL